MEEICVWVNSKRASPAAATRETERKRKQKIYTKKERQWERYRKKEKKKNSEKATEKKKDANKNEYNENVRERERTHGNEDSERKSARKREKRDDDDVDDKRRRKRIRIVDCKGYLVGALTDLTILSSYNKTQNYTRLAHKRRNGFTIKRTWHERRKNEEIMYDYLETEKFIGIRIESDCFVFNDVSAIWRTRAR